MMSSVLKSSIWFCIAILVSACTQVKTINTPPTRADVRSMDNAAINNLSLLKFAGSFAELPEEKQKEQFAQANQALASSNGDLNIKMKLAIIYALPNSRLHDVAKAQPLLDDILREPNTGEELKSLATVFRAHIAESHKLVQKTREEQKRADASQLKLDASQQKIDDLERKLNDLKSIERAMVDRDIKKRK
jgi:hypothetical protein